MSVSVEVMLEQSARVFLIDDDPFIHDAVQQLLQMDSGLSLVGQAYSGSEGLRVYAGYRPDIILMDIIMPDLNGMDTTQAILQQTPAQKILALSSYDEYNFIRAMLDSGAIGYLIKSTLVSDLRDTIRSTLRGNMVLSPQVAQALLSPPVDAIARDYGLTGRELEVLSLLAQGKTNAQIAALLHISASTARFHLTNILTKLAVETRSEALVLAARAGLI